MNENQPDSVCPACNDTRELWVTTFMSPTKRVREKKPCFMCSVDSSDVKAIRKELEEAKVYVKELEKCQTLVQLHHPSGPIMHVGLRCVAKAFEELIQELVTLRKKVRLQEGEVVAVLAGVPPEFAERVREGGAEENVFASLALTVSRLVAAASTAPLVRYVVLLETDPDGMHQWRCMHCGFTWSCTSRHPCTACLARESSQR